VATNTGKQVLVVAHAGGIRAVFAHVFAIDLNRAYNLRVDNAGITRLTHGAYGSVLVFHNSRLPEPS
jgi:broad specificity phosphatase PhoE